MTLLTLLIFVIVAGLLYWLVLQLPLPPPFDMIVRVVMILIAIVVLLGMAGVHTGLPRIR